MLTREEQCAWRQSILHYVRKDWLAFDEGATVQEVLDTLRNKAEKGDDVLYFYIINSERKLLGVVPVRRLLTANAETKLGTLMITRLVTLSSQASLIEACEAFVRYRFLSLPVVDVDGRLIGVVDAMRVNDEIVDLTERQASDEMFERIGMRLEAIKDASPWNAFRYRFPWLTATLISGLGCAVLASLYELTLAQSLVLTFFLTLVLGVGESVSMQSMTVTIQQLRVQRPTWQWVKFWFPRELVTAFLIGIAAGGAIGLIAGLWRQSQTEAWVIGGSLCAAVINAALIGRLVPTVLHGLRLDPKVSSGPLTLGLTDIMTLLVYFNVAKWILGVN
ncbi:MAG: magnesium transporter [Methylacidiphilales bacterium]|nr:magnesium transporter [Candidatus Methylacidiphilales bacterium]MDW8350108.1 magnesium transporter [Verrucomicrobiae bacterium]